MVAPSNRHGKICAPRATFIGYILCFAIYLLLKLYSTHKSPILYHAYHIDSRHLDPSSPLFNVLSTMYLIAAAFLSVQTGG
jgi:hypothetical protein